MAYTPLIGPRYYKPDETRTFLQLFAGLNTAFLDLLENSLDIRQMPSLKGRAYITLTELRRLNNSVPEDISSLVADELEGIRNFAVCILEERAVQPQQNSSVPLLTPVQEDLRGMAISYSNLVYANSRMAGVDDGLKNGAVHRNCAQITLRLSREIRIKTPPYVLALV